MEKQRCERCSHLRLNHYSERSPNACCQYGIGLLSSACGCTDLVINGKGLECAIVVPSETYTPWRKFLAQVGFTALLISIPLIIALVIGANQYIDAHLAYGI